MASLAVEYRPKKFSDVVEQDAVVKMLEGICKADELKNRNFLLIGPAGTGKAQPMWSKVLTVDGFLPMRQIQIGMEVYTHNGNIAKITGIYPQGERDIYTIYTKSGEYIDVADNHLNVIVHYKNSEMVEQVVDTLTLLNIYNRDPHNIYLPVYNITDHTIKQYTQITKIMYSGCYHCQCIMLDHEDHTYMTDGYIVTHNTTLGRIVSNELNDGKGEPIEIDAASHSGVDNVREIISQARTYPIGCKYKVFILDECFHENSIISTPDGDRRIKDIRKGNIVYNMEGAAEVSNVFVNAVNTSRLMIIRTNKGEIVTTVDHLFFTEGGWVEARNLKMNDILPTLDLIQDKLKFIDLDLKNIEYNSVVDVIDDNIRTVPILTKNKYSSRGYYTPNPYEAYLSDTLNLSLDKIEYITNLIPFNDDNIDYFLSYFSEEDIDSQYVMMYDLEIDGHPSYFVNNVLVHNCHSFSNTAWQSFLKVLEEGPAKTVFVFCTTNPEKIPATILSRVQTFQLSKISLDGIYSRLKYVLDSEISNGRDIKYDEDTLKFIAKLANGGMRDSLTLLDTALTYSNVINSENVSKALNLPDYDSYFELLSAYAKHDNVNITKIVDAVYNSGVNFTKWFERFHSFIVNIMKYIYLKDINLTMIPSHYIDKIQKYNTNHAIICLHLANVLVKLNHELKSTQYLQELALTYLCTTPKKG